VATFINIIKGRISNSTKTKVSRISGSESCRLRHLTTVKAPYFLVKICAMTCATQTDAVYRRYPGYASLGHTENVSEIIKILQ